VNGVNAKRIAGYVIMPGIIPRARDLLTSGFGYIAFLMAQIYFMVRLLPPAHAYLNPANIGRFGIRHVIAEAANNLVVSRRNIDQLVIFAVLLAGTVILILQFVLLLWGLFIQHAEAANLFNTVNFQGDIAFMLLDHVFGIPAMFNSCVATGAICPGATVPFGPIPFPFHNAMHDLFQFYSMGLLIIGVLIFLYFVVVVIVETATSGTPFGQRFANIWVPIRLVVALALLIPLNFGLNSGQYITLYAAKLGSGFATNAWIAYNDAIAAHAMFTAIPPNRPNPLGERLSLIAYPKQQDVSIIVSMMSLVHSCAYAYWRGMSSPPPASGGPPPNPAPAGVLDAAARIKPYFIKVNYPYLTNNLIREEVTAGMDYLDGLDFYDNSDIIIRFGEFQNRYTEDKGRVKSLCGDIRIRVGSVGGGTLASIANGGPEFILWYYFDLISTMWFNDARFREFALRMGELHMPQQDPNVYRQCGDGGFAAMAGCPGPAVNLPSCNAPPTPRPCQRNAPGADWKQERIQFYQTNLNAAMLASWILYSLIGADTGITNAVLNRGWAGAGIWWNKIAQYNGALITAVMDVPTMEAYPWVMEEVRRIKRQEDASFVGDEQFCPNLSDGQPVKIKGGDATDLDIAKALCATYKYWSRDGINQTDQEQTIQSNIILDTISIIFGTNGLFDMRNENAHTHPLAQLVAVGKGLVESTIRNIAVATGFAFLGGVLGAMEPGGSSNIPGIITALAGLLTSISFLGLTAGLVLFYVLPFLPFVYFYFAVANWVKTIFEAMVGVPLWALAHLRLDGNGLPGESASNGYFLIFEIFVRPILTVFGLVAAIVIFGAQVRILNFIWDMVTNNLTGFNDNPTIAIVADMQWKRGPIDQFFYTIIYTIIVYMLAMANFKLIDRIPENILRWMGAGVSAFTGINQEPIENLSRYVGTGGMVFGQQISSGLTSTASQAGQVIGRGLAGETVAARTAAARAGGPGGALGRMTEE
jgi:hypothetical protein